MPSVEIEGVVTEPLLPKDRYREAWLHELADMVRPIFTAYRLKPYRLTCGWPVKHGMAVNKRRIGECHYPKYEHGYHDIFVSPLLDSSVEVAGVVCHELAHVAAGFKAGHAAPFKRVCAHVGLTKNPPTSASPGPALEAKLLKIVGRLGPYPHTKIQTVAKPVKPKQEVSLYCVSCGCRVRISYQWLAKAGAPRCHCGGAMKEGRPEVDDE